MRLSVRWDPLAVRQLEKLPRDAAVRILAKVRQAFESPRLVEPLREHEFGCKIRAGDCRILVDVSHNPDELYVRYVGHRKNVYGRTK